MLREGVICSVNADERDGVYRFGFIKQLSGNRPRVFFHRTELDSELSPASVGQRVTFELKPGKKSKAVNVKAANQEQPWQHYQITK